MIKKALLIILAAVALTASAEFRWGPQAGLNINDYYWKQPLLKSDMRCGANAGLLGELMIPGIGFGVDFGLMYNLHSATIDLGSHYVWSSDGYKDIDYRMHTIQIPVHLRFKWTRMNGLEDYIAPFVYGGPDFSISFAHSKVKGNKGVKNPFTFPGGDLGLTAGGGFEIMHRWQISLQYTWGMTYIVKTRKLENQSARNRQWAVRVAYFLK